VLTRDQPDFAGECIVVNVLLGSKAPAHHNDLFVVGFTGDIERHRAELAAAWPAPTCVVQLRNSHRELETIESQLGSATHPASGLILAGAIGVNDALNVVDVQVLVAGEANQARMDQRFGSGKVRLKGLLQPA
jgi:hypothetical protein